MPTEFELAMDQICEEKGIPKEEVIKTIEAAIAAAYRKDYGKKGQNIEAEFEVGTGKTRLFELQEVVEEVTKPKRELTVEEAQEIKKGAELGDVIRTEVTPDEIEFGRIASQTAKQVITQRLREAERNVIFDNFKDQEGEVVNGVVQRIEKSTIFVDLGQATGVLFPSEQIREEHYDIGQRIKVYVVSVNQSQKGPEILLSRTHPDIVRKLFELEVPEIASGAVEIMAIAREAGSRSKVAVRTTQEEIDPVGACVGQRGTRVQTIINELSGEKIDIIEWDENPVRFITNALSPAKIISVKLNEDDKHAEVEVAEDQLSLAIGKGGQNVRLAVKLSGWNIDVVKEEKEGEEEKREKDEEKEEAAEEEKVEDTDESKEKAEETEEKDEAEPQKKYDDQAKEEAEERKEKKDETKEKSEEK